MSCFTKEIQYLGHILSTTGIKPLPSKQKQFKSWSHQGMPNKYGLSSASWAITKNVLKIVLTWQIH